MILLAESGATRSHWAFIDDNRSVKTIALSGFNPNYHNASKLLSIVDEVVAQIPNSSTVDSVIFYGSGCASDERAAAVSQLLNERFPEAQINVQGDLLAAARGMLGSDQGVAIILGTGSNAGIYDGFSLTSTLPSLGYIMGDEGSGSHLGRMLVKAYMQKQMPEKLALNFEAFTGLNRQNLISTIYANPSPGNFLASLAPFLSANINEIISQKIINQSFNEFFDILRLFLDQQAPCHLVATGSVASHFAPYLKKAARVLIPHKLIRIVPSPFQGLVSYHLLKPLK
jgi:N-acetylglucosamine kinase-like BadF-type ATPase